MLQSLKDMMHYEQPIPSDLETIFPHTERNIANDYVRNVLDALAGHAHRILRHTNDRRQDDENTLHDIIEENIQKWGSVVPKIDTWNTSDVLHDPAITKKLDAIVDNLTIRYSNGNLTPEHIISIVEQANKLIAQLQK